MSVSRVAVVGPLLLVCAFGSAPLRAQHPNDLAGSWTLNRQISDFPKELGFTAAFLAAVPGTGGGGGRDGTRARGGAAGGPERAPRIQQQTEEDARRIRFLADEVRLPPERLTLVVTPATVAITPDRGAARTVQPGKKDDELTLGPVTAVTNATWDGARLVVVYKAEAGRFLRYTYSATQNPAQLVVDTEFVERGAGDRVRRIYEPSRPDEPLTAPSTSGLDPPSTTASPGLALPPGALPSGSPRQPGATASSSTPGPSAAATAAIDQRPDASLKGLSRLGVVVENTSPDAAKCGLTMANLEASVTRRLTDAGFRVVRDSDDDTYMYVSLNTVSVTAALCVSRYDVTLYSHTAAPLSHTAVPVLVQAELLRRGGIAGGSPAQHADAVVKGVLGYVDQFVVRVTGANR